MPTVRLEDGLEMYYEDHDFTDPWRTPETVVMHHGNSKSSLLWYPWVPLLAGNYRVVRMDARGFGRSTVPAPGYDWSLEGFALDLKRFLDALGLDRVHLIGETVGGNDLSQVRIPVPREAEKRHHLLFALQVRGGPVLCGEPGPGAAGGGGAMGSARTRDGAWTLPRLTQGTWSGISRRCARPLSTWWWRPLLICQHRTCRTSCPV